MEDLPPEVRNDPKLAKLFKDLNLRAERAEARVEGAETRAAEQSRRADDEHRRAEEQTALSQPSTLEQMLEECHNHLALRFQIQPDPNKCTRGEMTRPEGKKCPKILLPWTNFLEEQQDAFDTAYEKLHPIGDPQRVFRPFNFYQGESRTFDNEFIGSEQDLRQFQHLAVERFVTDIMKALKKPIMFENHSRPLDRNNEEVVARLDKPRSADPVPRPAFADRYCISKDLLGAEQLLFVTEYKAPHKLTKEYIRAALNNAHDFDVHDIKDEKKPGDSSRQKYLSKSRRLVAAAATQTYHYMLEGGIQYGCVVTGEVFIFLRVKEQERTTLYFHTAEPLQEVSSDHDHSSFPHPRTTIAQLMSFCLMALQSPQRSQEWRDKAMQEAKEWTVDYGKLFLEIPMDLRELQKEIDKRDYSRDTSYVGQQIVIPPRSPYFMRKRPAPKFTANCNTTLKPLRDDGDDPDDDSWMGPNEDSPTKIAVEKKSASQKPSVKQGKVGSSSNTQRQYCTQACLNGLVRAHPIDPACPNAGLHPRSSNDRNKHAISKQKLCTLLRQQLARTLDEDCTDLKLGGARGMLFKLTLQSHGYVFVGKGTIKVFIPDLRHEGKIYGKMMSLQGKSMPVCLGNIDLEVPWYDIGIHIVHMLLLSFGGKPIAAELPGLREEINSFERDLERRGIVHRDLEERNMLWNAELGRVFFIDFERSSIENVKPERKVLQEVSPNRNWQTKRNDKSRRGKTDSSQKAPLRIQTGQQQQKENMFPDIFESSDDDDGEHTVYVAKLLDGLLLSTSTVNKYTSVIDH